MPVLAVLVFLSGCISQENAVEPLVDVYDKNLQERVPDTIEIKLPDQMPAHCPNGVCNDSENLANPEVIQNIQPQTQSEPPLKLKNIGVNLDYYNPVTKRAGDFEFTMSRLNFGLLFMDYGFVIPADMSSTRQDKVNPQPTFILPMGTNVLSLVDGVVVAVPQLYSGDYSIHVASSENSPWRYETEHVLNPLVKVGDKVKAGQVIAKVSSHDSNNNGGFGLLEIGVLKGGMDGPKHYCPFAYLDPAVKDDIEQKITAFYKSWEEFIGDSKLYDESSYTIPGCLTLEPVSD